MVARALPLFLLAVALPLADADTGHFIKLRILGAAAVGVSLPGRTIAKKARTALEASFKDRITTRLGTSVEAAVAHLAWRLDLGGSAFGGYELDIISEGESSRSAIWRHSCEKMNKTRDSVENCALRQLHSLAALCDTVDFAANADHVKLAKRLLKALTFKEVPSLVLERKNFDGAEIWLYKKYPGFIDSELSPAIQASVLGAVVRCAVAVDEKDYFTDAESWFEGLTKLYSERKWKEVQPSMTFHKSSIVWESLALVASYLPPESSFYEKLQRYLKGFESYLQTVWKEKRTVWSFASARALAIRWHSASLKGKKKRAAMRKWAEEHVDRFLGNSGGKLDGEQMEKGILERIGGKGYTCGPLQGLASIAAVLSEAKLVQVTLQLLEKDVEKYQISRKNVGPWGDLGELGINANGAFFRDPDQLEMESRESLRIDDTHQCVVALTQALRALEGIQGVVLDQAPEATESAAENGPQEGREAEL